MVFCLLSVYFHLVLWCSVLVTIRGALACLTIGFQLVVFVHPALLEMNLWIVFILTCKILRQMAIGRVLTWI